MNLRKKENLWSALIWGSTTVFTLLYISLIFNQNVWTDEIFTMKLLEGNFREIVEGTVVDVHPPLYYFVAKLAQMIFGKSLQVQKLVTIVPMTLTMVLGATKIRRMFGDKVSFFFILILGCIPCSMEFAVQVRMYSMALLAVTACGLYAYECYFGAATGAKSGGDASESIAPAPDGVAPAPGGIVPATAEKWSSWVGLVLSTVAAAYLHYFAFGSVIIVQGILFLALLITKREKLKKWFLSAAAMILAYLPWFGVFIGQFRGVSESYWIPEITLETIWSYFEWTFGINKWEWPCYLFTALCVCAGISALVGCFKKRKDDVCALLFMAVPALTGITGVALSWLIRPIYRDQYVFPALGLFCLFLAIELSHYAEKKWILYPVCLFLLFMGAVQYLETYRQEYKSTLTDQTVEFWNEHVGENDIIVYNLEIMRFCYTYYFPEDKLFYVRDVDLDQDFDAIWFIDTAYEWEFVPDQILPYDLQIEYQGHFGIEHNEFDLYKVTKGPNAGLWQPAE